MNSPLLQHINENIEAIEEMALLSKLKSSMTGMSSLFGNGNDKFKHGHIGDVVHTSKLLGKISVLDITTSGIIFKDYQYVYTSKHKIPSVKRTSMVYVGNENTGAPNWTDIERNVKLIPKVIPKIVKDVKSEHALSAKDLKINLADIVVYEYGTILYLYLAADISVDVIVTVNGQYEIMKIAPFVSY